MKKWWQSKTVWTNVLSLVGIVASGALGVQLPVSPTTATAIVAGANIGLRLISGEVLTK